MNKKVIAIMAGAVLIGIAGVVLLLMPKEEPVPQDVINQQEVMQETIQDIAEQNNMTPEEVEAELQEELSPEAVEVIEEVLNEDVLPQMPENINDIEVTHTEEGTAVLEYETPTGEQVTVEVTPDKEIQMMTDEEARQATQEIKESLNPVEEAPVEPVIEPTPEPVVVETPVETAPVQEVVEPAPEPVVEPAPAPVEEPVAEAPAEEPVISYEPERVVDYATPEEIAQGRGGEIDLSNAHEILSQTTREELEAEPELKSGQ